MSMQPLISIVMPAFNAEPFIAEAIRSVLAQTHTNWELLIVNDGSTDGTGRMIASFTDPRIRTWEQANGGIGSARNLALDHALGSFICFLDADDVLPPGSIHDRLQVFVEHPNTDIADGRMLVMDGTLEHTIREFVPSFTGDPFRELTRLSSSCFGGVTWMLRWSNTEQLRFDTRTTQMEDLLFIISYSLSGRIYRATAAPVLVYRRTGKSSSSDLEGMESSYRYVHHWLTHSAKVPRSALCTFRSRSRKVMFLSWLYRYRPLRALRSVFRPFR